MKMRRREALKTIAAASVIGLEWNPRTVAADEYGLFFDHGRRLLRVAAIQMTIRHGNVDANMETAARLVRRAIKDGATWITLPEFFTSGFGSGNDPALKDAHRPLHGGPTELLKQLARSAGGAVGGSFLAQRDKDTYNTYVLALADGRIFFHDKDTPSLGAEASNFIGGDDDGVLQIPEANLDVGAALCWELTRMRTARRLRGRVDIVLAGSAYLDNQTLFDDVFLTHNDRILDEMPRNLARLVGVPVVHANPVGCVVIGEYDDPDGEYTYDYMGRSQIVDRQGRTIAVRERAMGEGVVVADVEVTRRQPSDELEDRFWIPDVPDLYRRFFEENRPKGAKIYQEFTRPYRNRR